MQTLKDIKNALIEIPDKTLDSCWFGIGEGSEETIQLVTSEEGETGCFTEVFKKYPKLTELNNLILNIVKAQEVMDNQDKAEELNEQLQEEGITDTFFNKGKKPSSNQIKSPSVFKEDIK